MCHFKIDGWPYWYNACWVDHRVATIIMLLDMAHIDRLRHAGRLEEIAQIAGEVRVIVNAADVAFEVADIDRIETHQRGEQPSIGLRLLSP